MHDADKLFYGNGLPYLKVGPLKGSLIVLEGTDSVGRSTQIEALTRWLEVQGYGVVNTGWTRSPLLSETINEAKAGHELNVTTFSLLSRRFRRPPGESDRPRIACRLHRDRRSLHVHRVRAQRRHGRRRPVDPPPVRPRSCRISSSISRSTCAA
jgi:hypothetical protein